MISSDEKDHLGSENLNDDPMLETKSFENFETALEQFIPFDRFERELVKGVLYRYGQVPFRQDFRPKVVIQ